MENDKYSDDQCCSALRGRRLFAASRPSGANSALQMMLSLYSTIFHLLSHRDAQREVTALCCSSSIT